MQGEVEEGAMRKTLVAGLAWVLIGLTCGMPGGAADPPRVLFLSKSSGFQHPSIARKDGQPSHVETVLEGVAKKHGFELITTKNAGWIDAKKLENLDAVVFYTTGDLTQAGSGEGLFGGDGEGAMPVTGVRDLAEWVRDGGAFLGFHSASDTFHDQTGAPSPYVELLGGEFVSHGRQFAGSLRVVDEAHPTMARIPAAWTVMDEWYTFKNLATDRIHVLALLETEAESRNQETYNLPPYPVIWCSELGKGRVFYNAMGHREDVWDLDIFQDAFADALSWALGTGPAAASPNYADVVDAD